MDIVLVDYKAGNLTSVARALKSLGVEACVTNDPNRIANADKVIFPGVGAAGSCMHNLQVAGLDEALRTTAAAGKPLLGICVGMQLLFERSAEDNGVDCLGLFSGTVEKFDRPDPSIKIPHMGWNPTTFTDEVLGVGLGEDPCFYYVHSYYCAPAEGVNVIATSHHGREFCAGVRKDNVVAVQFHPEKSGPVGLKLLQNFVEAK